MNFQVKRLQVPDNLLDEVTIPTLASLSLFSDPSILIGGLVIAIVASAETLLCATALDQMQSGPRTDYDKELAA